MKIIKHLKYMALASLLLASLWACSPHQRDTSNLTFDHWQEVEDSGRDQEVTILMWGGNAMINTYMDQILGPALESMYNIRLNRVPMNAPDYLNKLILEKNGKINQGNADLVWINAENFRTAQQGDLLWGPFTDLLPNNASFNDLEAHDLKEDTGIAIQGMEALWGRAQLVLTTDSTRLTTPPKSYGGLLAWAKENPGRFTYPQLPDDFVGSAFVRGALYELHDQEDFSGDYTEEAFKALMVPVLDYFQDLHPYLWRQGQAFPKSQAQLDDLFLNGEVDFTMGFELGKTAGMVQSGLYPDSAYSYIFETGSIGNAHYLAIPFNAPQKAAALLTIDLLQSPDLQLKKFDPKVWGDMPALAPDKLSKEDMEKLLDLESQVFTSPLSQVYQRRLPELKAQYIDWAKESWVDRFAK